MATATTTTTTKSISTKTSSAQLKVQVQPIKPKRRKCKETTISSSASTAAPTTATTAATNSYSESGFSGVLTRKLDPPTIVSPDNTWCCPASKPLPTPPPPPPSPPLPPQARRGPDPCFADSISGFRIRYSPGSLSPVMDFTGGTTLSNGHSPSSFTKFNSALTAGLLNPMSPPPPPDKTRSSPTLFEMMASEPDIHPRNQSQNQAQIQVPISAPRQNQPPPVIDKQALTMQRISDLLSNRSPGNQFNDPGSSDIKLTLSSKDGINVSMNVHRQILVAHSRFFAVKLSDRWAKQQRNGSGGPYIVEIADCDDVEVYIETLRLMYCKDLRKKLMREDVSKVLGILKVSAAIGFDAGVLSCLEYLEAAPWAEDEEEKVASLLAELRLENVGAGEVLKRVSVEVTNGTDEGGDNEEVLLKLLHVVLEGKDEKARREMKGLVSKMLRENSSQNDLRKESLYSACDGCLELLRHHFLRAASSDLQDVSQIARQADNLHWILDILIDRQIAEDFLKSWASQSELSDAHSKVPAVHRYEVSRVTARLFVGIGKGQLLASKEMRCLLLQTWLVPFYDDFGWMRRASKGLDRHLVEDGLSNTILTLPLAWQQEILLAWFDRFLNSGEDCPNIQRGFEVWWRRAFWRRSGEQEPPRQLQVTTATIENS
ncbi:BTB/POZ domain-containing protein isoform 1 [Theobroma cacao]|uniref:BTB/POZ domain-containing protein isoform 1 n=1 Tax=Theobroma cacao TaxID=3641 RepID=A0A061G5G9_THECC|nr:BTB/POZ domain-containing protein isoform 1 [Theobroma cacao]EOY24817.1 BTB/POZ domain-containing protein isoform 1 [Theobroma cacao]EOY24820.1 BTB/POZ domain-containing protein isoform 1 [Theobroma cacao]